MLKIKTVFSEYQYRGKIYYYNLKLKTRTHWRKVINYFNENDLVTCKNFFIKNITGAYKKNGDKLSKIRIGFQYENFIMSSLYMNKMIKTKINGEYAFFWIKAGYYQNALDSKTTYKKTLILEINYYESYSAYKNGLLIEGFGPHTYADFAEEANKLAIEICNNNGWVINQHLNSWPELKAIVTMITVKDIISPYIDIIKNILYKFLPNQKFDKYCYEEIRMFNDRDEKVKYKRKRYKKEIKYGNKL